MQGGSPPLAMRVLREDMFSAKFTTRAFARAIVALSKELTPRRPKKNQCTMFSCLGAMPWAIMDTALAGFVRVAFDNHIIPQ